MPTKLTAYTGHGVKNAPPNPPLEKVALDVSTSATFAAAVKDLQRPGPKDGLYVCFEEYETPVRRKEHVKAKTAVVLDVEYEGTPTWDTLDRMSYLYAAYTTPSHTEESPRWRVIVPLSKPFPVETAEDQARFESLYYAVAAMVKGGFWDPCGKQLARAMYTPREIGENGHGPKYESSADFKDAEAGDIIAHPLDESEVEYLIKKGQDVKVWATATKQLDRFVDPKTGEVQENVTKPLPVAYLQEHGGKYPESFFDVAAAYAEEIEKITAADQKRLDEIETQLATNPAHHGEETAPAADFGAVDTERDAGKKWKDIYKNDPVKAKTYKPETLRMLLEHYHPGQLKDGKISCIIPGHIDKDPSMTIAPSGTHLYCHGGSCPGNPYNQREPRTVDMYDLVCIEETNFKKGSIYAVRLKTYEVLDKLTGGKHNFADEFKKYVHKYAPETEPPPPTAEGGTGDQLDRKKNGDVKKTYLNLLRIIEGDPKLKGIKRNTFLDDIEVSQPMPWNHSKVDRVDDFFFGNLLTYIAETYKVTYTTSTIKTAVDVIADRHFYHPIREYLNNLPEWDGTPRVETIFADLFGAPDTPLHRAVAKKFLSAAVQRVFNPGTEFQYCLVLVGPQGIGKSSFLHRLGGKWFSDSLTFADMKDNKGKEKAGSAWILELSELQGKSRVEDETVKSFIKMETDHFRAAYDRRPGIRPRQCVFAATTNAEEGFLTDPTGGRIWWIIETPGTKSEIPARTFDVEQVWAEVMAKYRNEVLTIEDPALQAQMKSKQAGMTQWQDIVPDLEQYFAHCLKKGLTRVRSCDVMKQLKHMGWDPKSGSAHNIKLAASLIPGWEYIGRMKFGKTGDGKDIIGAGYKYNAESIPTTEGDPATVEGNITE